MCFVLFLFCFFFLSFLAFVANISIYGCLSSNELNIFKNKRPILKSTLVNAEVMEKTVLNINSIQKQN